MAQYDYLVVGAGLFGAIFAHEANKRGKKVLVIDKRDHVAGNIYTKEVEDSPIAYYKGQVYNMPFNMNTFSKLWPEVRTPAEAKAKIEAERAKVAVENPKNLEEQALSLGGKEIYEIFVKGYTQKQWGRPCTELPAFIIKRLPFRFTYDNNYFNDDYQGIPIGGYTQIVEKMLDGICLYRYD